MRLVLSILADDRPGIVREITDRVLEQQCNVLDSHMATLDGVFAISMLIEGDPSQVAALEQGLWQAAEEGKYSVALRQARPDRDRTAGEPWTVRVTAMDHPGIVNSVARFLSDRGINIERMETRSEAAAHTATPMFSVTMQVLLPPDLERGGLQQDFESLCQEHGLDGRMQPSQTPEGAPA